MNRETSPEKVGRKLKGLIEMIDGFYFYVNPIGEVMVKYGAQPIPVHGDEFLRVFKEELLEIYKHNQDSINHDKTKRTEGDY